MTVSPDIHTAFTAWAYAELASHYAQPCPDEIMFHLVNETSERAVCLANMPAETAEDVLMKVFPILLANCEPLVDGPPMVLEPSQANGEDVLILAVVEDLRRICPVIAEVMKAPHYRDQRRAA